MGPPEVRNRPRGGEEFCPGLWALAFCRRRGPERREVAAARLRPCDVGIPGACQGDLQETESLWGCSAPPGIPVSATSPSWWTASSSSSLIPRDPFALNGSFDNLLAYYAIGLCHGPWTSSGTLPRESGRCTAPRGIDSNERHPRTDGRATRTVDSATAAESADEGTLRGGRRHRCPAELRRTDAGAVRPGSRNQCPHPAQLGTRAQEAGGTCHRTPANRGAASEDHPRESGLCCLASSVACINARARAATY